MRYQKSRDNFTTAMEMIDRPIFRVRVRAVHSYTLKSWQSTSVCRYTCLQSCKLVRSNLSFEKSNVTVFESSWVGTTTTSTSIRSSILEDAM